MLISFKIRISFLLLLVYSITFSQNANYAVIDKYASAPTDNINTLDQLYTHLIKPAKTETEKVRSFYVWIATHIKYDMQSYLADTIPSYKVGDVIKSRIGVCMGMANVMHALCKKAKLESFMVDGYSKGLSYVEGQRLTIPDHIWNAVKLNGKWYLFDVTWDITGTNLPEYYPDRKFKGKYFMMPGDQFMSKHLPADPVWQLSDQAITINDFEKSSWDADKIKAGAGKKIAWKDSIIAIQKMNYEDSLLTYAKHASDFNPLNSEATVLLGLCYFDKGDEQVEALKKISAQQYDKQYKQYEAKINGYYDKAYTILTKVKPGEKYYKEAQEAAEAIAEYRVNTDIHNITTTDVNYKSDKNFVPVILKKEIKCDIHKLDNVNSEYRETNLSISPDGNLLLLMSDRGGQPWSVSRGQEFRGKPSYDGDLWYSKKVNGSFGKAICFDKTINTSSGEDEPNISPDGRKIIYQSWKSDWKYTGGPYYIADRKGESISNPKGLGDGIARFFIHAYTQNNGYGTDGASMSPDGKRFIVSCGSNYGKDLDLYISDKNKSDKWALLKPLPFNTKKDDRSVFIAADGKTVFFASDGYGGFGGLDIFKTTIDEKGNIGPILNLGEKFNTKGDDYSFILSASGKEAYFIRDGDVYEALFAEPVAELMPGRSLVVKGTITHNYDTELSFKIKLINNTTKEELSTLSSKDSNSYYLFLNTNNSKSFTIAVYNGSLKVGEEIINPDTTRNYEETIKNFTLHINKKAEVKDTNITRVRVREEVYETGMLSNINFGYDSYVIAAKEKTKLDQIADYMKKHKRAKLGIAGYCDIRGNNDYNLPLSLKRAKAVAQYLQQKGVAKNRLIVNAYASKNPLTLDATIEGGWLNRRVEFKIVNDFPE